MFSITPKTSWGKPMDMNLHVDWKFEPLTPFNLYVSPSPITQKNLPSPTFHLFSDLVVELQLHILKFCGAATLFQLMRASPATRNNAQELFWSLKEPWYRVPGTWLLEDDAGFAGPVLHCTEFTKRVERLELEFSGIEHYLKLYSEDHIRTFWRTFQRCFPYATHVIFVEKTTYQADEMIPTVFASIVRACPSRIHAFISRLEQSDDSFRLESTLWSLGEASPSEQWVLVSLMWTRRSIQVPPKRCRGLLGAYQYNAYKEHMLSQERSALRLLRLDVRERYHFDGRCVPFDCPRSDCDIRFEGAGQWTLHAVKTRHDESFNWYDTISPEAEASIREKEKSIEQESQELKAWHRKLFDDWNEDGCEKRQLIEEAFLDQLEHDPLHLHQKPPRECSTWKQFVLEMDPTYVYSRY